MLPTKVHHIGIACKDIIKTRASVCRLHGLSNLPEIVQDPRQEIELCLIPLDSGLHLELVAGTKVENLLKKGSTYYHLCYEVPDLESSITNLRALGCFPVFGPIEAVLFGGRRVVFLMSPMVLVELLEDDKRSNKED